MGSGQPPGGLRSDGSPPFTSLSERELPIGEVAEWAEDQTQSMKNTVLGAGGLGAHECAM